MTVSREEMIALDRRAIEMYEIPSLLLMENAGMGIFHHIREYNSYTFVVTGGNNGGDGLVIARHLLLNGKDVEVYIVESKRSSDFSRNLKILSHLTDNIYEIKGERDYPQLVEALEVAEVCVDGLFGTGLSRPLEGIFYDVVDLINDHGNFVISIDISSGMDADTGDEWGNCVISHETYALCEIKTGSTLNNKSGKITPIYIGIPRALGEIYP